MEEVNVLTDESLMLDIDIIEKKHEQELAEKDKTIAEKEQTITALEQENYRLKQQLKQL
jgi:uncharacterized protein (DUF3084 family)